MADDGEVLVSAFTSLKSRAAISWIRERDVDLLLCAELHGNELLQGFFAKMLGCEGEGFDAAWVSHAELAGESDLVLVYGAGDAHTLALVENKIDAAFQKDQGLRYARRAQRWAKEPGISRVVTVLIAPTRYQSSAGEQKFDVRIDYEDVAEMLKECGDRRSAFLAQTLEAGIEAARRGYVMNPNATVTDMWLECWRISSRVTPRLHFSPPGLKPGQSTWFYFREAEGFDGLNWRQAVVVYKAERGQADLQFGGVSLARLASLTEGLLTEGMTIVPAGKSSSVRIAVKPIDFFGMVEPQLEAIEIGLRACERLRQLLVTHRSHLAPVDAAL